MTDKKFRHSTLCVHAGAKPDPSTGSRTVPIYQTAAYVFENSEHAKNLFALKETGNIYTRLNNPTTAVFEERIAAIEGGVGSLATSSGMSAISSAILTFTSLGDEILSGDKLYGGTHELFSQTFPKLGRTVSFADSNEPSAFEEKITEKTRGIFVEAIGNPGLDIPDFERLAKIAHENEIPLIVDNTVGVGLTRPIEFGADIVVHSATKYIGGHGNSIGGVITDSGNFNWNTGKFPEITEPDESYGGIRYHEQFGSSAFIVKARVQFMRDMGPCISPFNSFMLLTGLETLPLRVKKHSQNALAVAEFLRDHPKIEWVCYPGLSSHPSHENAKKYLTGGFGPIVGAGVKGGIVPASKLTEEVKLFSHLANIGDTKSLIVHPASTTHSQLSLKDRRAAGVLDNFVRLAIGIEDEDDLIEDLNEALKRV
ncbi:O-acetylhomoserine aminocarboxypropyltransferase/cysteine synthase [Methanoplanus sp. FWC-SCC4]|uniref:O-acetylhomoserine aminocarboxypropyltransferase/cysteine synthase n=1 Tax=Methanochimaera problematica TaxID=2609417 RepID=A0AA97I420_9EURY|nr:O-acetylhomoserine aminocarboxypropyltransferase/cysteine synthase family protein [Methanoplanus sp. FWC-SCC4]WOF17263.1 O-acetylhomoserine aminocarboxypropyltransferase/cysteine synthase [Methanoplanus sp. FWC-SCC4]